MDIFVSQDTQRKIFAKKKTSWFSRIINLLLITGIILIGLSLFSQVFALKSGVKAKKGEIITSMQKVESLYFISQDLDDDAAVLLRPDAGCYCSCRDGAWACTDLMCPSHLKECGKIQAQLTGTLDKAPTQTPDYLQAVPSLTEDTLTPDAGTQNTGQPEETPNYSSQSEVTPTFQAPPPVAVERDPRFMDNSRY